MTTASQTHVIFDFDQTLVDHESTLEIVKSAIGDHPDAQAKLEQLTLITPKALSGHATVRELLHLVTMVLRIRKHHIHEYVEAIIGKLDPVLVQMLQNLQQNGTHVHILSGGYTEWITPIARSIGIHAGTVTANRLFWAGSRAICPRPSPLINPSKGKSKIVGQWRKSGRLQGRVLIVGDAASDHQVYVDGWVDGFVCVDYYTKHPMPEVSGHILRASSPRQVYPHLQALIDTLPCSNGQA